MNKRLSDCGMNPFVAFFFVLVARSTQYILIYSIDDAYYCITPNNNSSPNDKFFLRRKKIVYKRQSFFWPESTIEQVKMWKECFLRFHLFQRDYYCDVVLREKKHTHTPSNNNNKIKENELLGWRKCITVAYRPTNHPVCTIRLRSDHKRCVMSVRDTAVRHILWELCC